MFLSIIILLALAASWIGLRLRRDRAYFRFKRDRNESLDGDCTEVAVTLERDGCREGLGSCSAPGPCSSGTRYK